MVLVNTPTWGNTAEGKEIITLDGATEYLELPNADCLDLDFTTEDYSIGMWFKWTTGNPTLILMGRYEIDVGGWEFYLADNAGTDRILTLRHNHAGGATVRSACYSINWTKDVWWFVGCSRDGAAAQHYRNGNPIATTHGVGGLEGIETTTQDLTIGVRYTKNANYYCGPLGRTRIWNRVLTRAEWLQIFETERHLYGV
ncbi:MAG: LamG domain-containing protein [ANME-2 cluster archaeon]|nr:MAG: LamG domain-containing protein [ANME-2 cluster archaeon]